MKQLLEKDLPQAYGFTRQNITITTSTLSGTFSLNDRCTDCKTKLESLCNQENILIEAKADVSLIYFEQYIEQFGDKTLGKGKKCDYLLIDNPDIKRKIAFCELTCAKEDTIEPDEQREHLPEGKRAKAISQLEQSVKRFTKKDISKQFLAEYVNRHCIFGWRDPFSSNVHIPRQRGDVDANMQIVGFATSGSEALLLKTQVIDDLEFTFYQVKYPAAYKW